MAGKDPSEAYLRHIFAEGAAGALRWYVHHVMPNLSVAIVLAMSSTNSGNYWCATNAYLLESGLCKLRVIVLAAFGSVSIRNPFRSEVEGIPYTHQSED